MLNSDEQLLALVRVGSDRAFEALVRRYHARLLAFCTQILRSESDAEDVLQETFVAALHTMRADARPIDVSPWFYRIARNRCLNHRRSILIRRAAGLDQYASEDTLAIRPADDGISAAERVARRESFRLLVSDIGNLPETQRSALLLRELHGLSYDQVAGVLETSVPSVKSLLVRARGSLVEASEAREIPCDDARRVLTQAAEGLVRVSAPVRSHVKHCDDCRAFQRHLKKSTKLVAAISPVGSLFTLKALPLTKLGAGAGATGSAGTAAGVSVTTTVGATTGLGVAAKAVAGVATVAALITGPANIERAVRDQIRSGTTAPMAAPAARARVGEARPTGANPSAATDGKRPAAPEPVAEIHPSTPAPAAPQGAPGRPADPAHALHRAPSATVQGHPIPGLNTGRLTHPAPPPSAEDPAIVVDPEAAIVADPEAPPAEAPVPPLDEPPVSGEPTSGTPGAPQPPAP